MDRGKNYQPYNHALYSHAYVHAACLCETYSGLSHALIIILPSCILQNVLEKYQLAGEVLNTFHKEVLSCRMNCSGM